MSQSESGGGAPQQTQVTLSRGFIAWLERARCGIAFTSYQTGQLFFVGLTPDRKISLLQTAYVRAMGVPTIGGRLLLASDTAIWRLENVLQPGQIAKGMFDRMYVPR